MTSSSAMILKMISIGKEATRRDADKIGVDLRVMISAIRVQRGRMARVDYYIACTGAEVRVDVSGGEVQSYSKPMATDVTYQQDKEKSRAATIKVAPVLKAGGGELEAEVASVETEFRRGMSSTASYQAKEKSVTPLVSDTKSQVAWIIDMPRGEKAYRDFLEDEFQFDSEWARAGTGSVSVRARSADVRFFDDDKREIGKIASYLMLFAIWRKGISLNGIGEWNAEFEVQ